MSGGPGRERRGPRPLSDILGKLVSARGYGRTRGQAELEAAWARAVGEPACRRTRLGTIRRGVLSVTVAHPALLEELSAFRKAEILEALRRTAWGATVRDLRFRVGPVDEADDGEPPRAAGTSPEPGPGVPGRPPQRPDRG